jgi:membrane-associated protease RseP (regulator of RpoE activity)
MTDDQQPEPLEPVPVSAPPTDPASRAVEPPTVEAPAATAPAAPPPPPAPPRRTHVTVPLWALAAVGGVVLLALGFLLGWVLAPGDDDDSTADSAGNAQELPFGGNFSPFGPDGNGNGSGGNGGGRFGLDEDTAYLGVVVADSSDPEGAEIQRVAPDSPAEDAALEDGDVITEVDGDGVDGAAALTERIQDLEAGDTVEIGYERDGEERTVEVELDERPALRDLLPPTTRPRATS